MKLEHQRALIVFLWIGFSAQVGLAQGVPGLFDWTYQGRLMQDGSASDGLFDFEFNIFDAASEGNLVAGPETKEGVTVSGGLFAVALQFGPEVFRALEPRYLEIGVRVNGSGLPFTMLTPRQLLSPAPAALVANEARGATGTFRIASGSPAQIVLGNDNSVKIGRDTAANALTMLSPGALHLVRPDAEGLWR